MPIRKCTHRSKKTQTTVKHLESSVTAQMEENLSSVSEHLTQLDLQIQDNQNTLEQVFSQGESLGTSVENLKEKNGTDQGTGFGVHEKRLGKGFHGSIRQSDRHRKSWSNIMQHMKKRYGKAQKSCKSRFRASGSSWQMHRKPFRIH